MSKQALQDLRDKVAAGETPTKDEWRFVFPDLESDDDYSRAMKAHAACLGWIDAARALHNVVLPGWGWEVSSQSAAAVFKGPDLDGPCELASGETPARAWLLAILSALIAQQTDTAKEGE